METEGKLCIADVFVGIGDPRQAKMVRHKLVELLVVAICAVVSGADTFVEVEAWGKAKLDWLRRYLRLEHGIPSHDTFSRVFAAIDADRSSAAFRRWVSTVLPTVADGAVVVIDGKTSPAKSGQRLGCWRGSGAWTTRQGS